MKDTEGIEITDIESTTDVINNNMVIGENPMGFGETVGRIFDKEFPELSSILLNHGSDILNNLPEVYRFGVNN